MKALSIRPLYATLIALGAKSIELRSWKTEYRGWLLICSGRAANKFERQSMVTGKAIAVAHLSDVRPYVDETDREPACLFDDEHFSGFSWILDSVHVIEPIPIKGRLSLFNVEYEVEDLLPLPLDYESETYPDDLFNWWLDNKHIENLDFLSD
ncbi:MAG: ASCH domain-containing protein [Bacillota bacterium]|nr:ASCH domain-containing protein [Bacillota bacterium]